MPAREITEVQHVGQAHDGSEIQVIRQVSGLVRVMGYNPAEVMDNQQRSPNIPCVCLIYQERLYGRVVGFECVSEVAIVNGIERGNEFA